jgi:hypothetical protein
MVKWVRDDDGAFVSDDGRWRIELAPSADGKSGAEWWVIEVNQDGTMQWIEPAPFYTSAASLVERMLRDEAAAKPELRVHETKGDVLTLRDQSGRLVAQVTVAEGRIGLHAPEAGLHPDTAAALGTLLHQAAAMAHD